MKLLMVRHAIAQEREDFDLPNDDLRPLTSKGKKEFEKISKLYKKLYPEVDLILSSPLVRALQTSDILKKKYKKNYEVIKELRPEVHPKDLYKKLKSKKINFIVIVGHEPSLSEFVGYLITGKQQSIIELKKGGACLIDLDTVPQILNLHSPKNLLKLGKLN